MTEHEILERLEQLQPLLEPKKPGAEDVDAMNARAERMELLYVLHKRDEAPLGLSHTYTELELEHRRYVEGLNR